MSWNEELWTFAKIFNGAVAVLAVLAMFWLPAYYIGKSNARMECQINKSGGE